MLMLYMLINIPAVILGSRFGEQFVRDVVNSVGAERCDFGYINDQRDSKITNQIIDALSDR